MKISFANYFQKDKIQFSQGTLQLICTKFENLFWFLLQII